MLNQENQRAMTYMFQKEKKNYEKWYGLSLECDSKASHRTRSEECIVVVVHSLSHVQLFAIPWTVAHQAPVYGISQAGILEWVAISYCG